jgi:exotoxin A
MSTYYLYTTLYFLCLIDYLIFWFIKVGSMMSDFNFGRAYNSMVNSAEKAPFNFLGRLSPQATVEEVTNWHKMLLDRGYVFMGYHGTNTENAMKLITNTPENTPRASTKLQKRWQGFYVSRQIEVAQGYAHDQKGQLNGRILRVYLKQAQKNNHFISETNINEFENYPELLHRNSTSVFTGPDGTGGTETAIKEGLLSYCVITPSSHTCDKISQEELNIY